jgi:hypothetical protein
MSTKILDSIHYRFYLMDFILCNICICNTFPTSSFSLRKNSLGRRPGWQDWVNFRPSCDYNRYYDMVIITFLCYFFPKYRWYINFDKKWFGLHTFVAIFSQAHLVTLVGAFQLAWHEKFCFTREAYYVSCFWPFDSLSQSAAMCAVTAFKTRHYETTLQW